MYVDVEYKVQMCHPTHNPHLKPQIPCHTPNKLYPATNITNRCHSLCCLMQDLQGSLQLFLKATSNQHEGLYFHTCIRAQLFIPVSHHGLLSCRILTKDGANRGTGGFKGILIQIQSIEHSVVKPN